MLKKKLRCASFFAGVGGIDLAFQQTGYFQTVYANEIDKYPAAIFNANNSIKADVRDIREVSAADIPDFDILLAGFPCQPFSTAGARGGLNDKRGLLFYELVRIAKEKKPIAMLLENVPGLRTLEKGEVFKGFMRELNALGYNVFAHILCPTEYAGFPVRRKRLYIACFLHNVPFEWPAKIPVIKTQLSDIVDFETPMPDKYYYTEQNRYYFDALQRAGEADKIGEFIYCPNLWERGKMFRKSNLLYTLHSRSGTGGHNVQCIKTSHGYRKLTPREYYNAQGFPADFILPADMSDGRLYKAAGNSVNVLTVRRIAEQMHAALGRKGS